MYNLGRAAHQLGLSQIAMTLYEQALQVRRGAKPGWLERVLGRILLGTKNGLPTAFDLS